MPRPKKTRTIHHIHVSNQFNPKECEQKRIILLNIDELESIRLMDLEGYDQIQSAKMMNLARTTFQRVLESARKKVAQALVDGVPILAKGFDIDDKSIVYHCSECEKDYTYEELCEGNCSHCMDIVMKKK
jgi:predicted DNA-binding protein (UPF0251 family)